MHVYVFIRVFIYLIFIYIIFHLAKSFHQQFNESNLWVNNLYYLKWYGTFLGGWIIVIWFEGWVCIMVRYFYFKLLLLFLLPALNHRLFIKINTLPQTIPNTRTHTQTAKRNETKQNKINGWHNLIGRSNRFSLLHKNATTLTNKYTHKLSI